jgi:hypothetical protein
MKYMFELASDRKLVFNEAQLQAFINAIDDAEMVVDKHVGNNQGTHGYSNSYVHDIKPPVSMEWFKVIPLQDDYVEALRLAAKLGKET